MRFSCLRLRGLVVSIAVLCGCGDGDEHVGSRDCEIIKDATDDPDTHAACNTCQGAACGLEACVFFPCVNGEIVVQGCNEDKQCASFPGTRCGRYSGPDLVCSSHPDDM